MIVALQKAGIIGGRSDDGDRSERIGTEWKKVASVLQEDQRLRRRPSCELPIRRSIECGRGRPYVDVGIFEESHQELRAEHSPHRRVHHLHGEPSIVDQRTKRVSVTVSSRELDVQSRASALAPASPGVPATRWWLMS